MIYLSVWDTGDTRYNVTLDIVEESTGSEFVLFQTRDVIKANSYATVLRNFLEQGGCEVVLNAL